MWFKGFCKKSWKVFHCCPKLRFNQDPLEFFGLETNVYQWIAAPRVCGISLSEENEFRWIKNDVNTAPFSEYLLVHYSENKVYDHIFIGMLTQATIVIFQSNIPTFLFYCQIIHKDQLMLLELMSHKAVAVTVAGTTSRHFESWTITYSLLVRIWSA